MDFSLMLPAPLKKRKSFLKVFIPILSLLILLQACFVGTFYQLAEKNIKTQMSTRCLGIATAVSTLIEHDIDNFKNFIITLNTDSSYYKRIKSTLEDIYYNANGDVVYLDISIRYSEDELMYIFDGIKEGTSSHFVKPGTIDKLSNSGKEAYTLKRPYIADFSSNSSFLWGNLLSAYAPIENSNNELIGMVAVQVSIEKYREVMRGLYLLAICSLILASAIAAFILAYSLGRLQTSLSLDNITGLHNHNFLLKKLKLKQQNATGDNLTIIFMAKLDQLKDINYTYGYRFGELALKHVARIFCDYLDKSDCVVRYAGEDFAGYLSNLDLKASDEIAKHILHTVASTPIHNKELAKDIHITISIGCAVLNASESPLENLKNADMALQEAKKTHNNVVFWAPDAEHYSTTRNMQ